MKNDLSILLEKAGEATSSPPLPPAGIPRQRVPGWIRWPLRLFFLPFVIIDVAAQKTAAFILRTPFKKEGKCLQRGNCCHYILIEKGKGFFGWLYFFWNTEINGFYLRTKELHESEGKKVFVMGCRYLQPNGKCGHYRLRPAVCRKWPLISYFGLPQLLKGCGFRPIPRGKD